ncbi:MAG: heterodisulfide reductase-related iron-sulfur binding cluster [Candidatus Nezhaarchaeales archaeon]
MIKDFSAEAILFPGCRALNKYPGISSSSLEVLKLLGLKVKLPTNILCCGRPVESTGILKDEQTNALAYFNLTKLMDKPRYLIVVCNGCYSVFSRALSLRELKSEYGIDPECFHVAEVVWLKRHDLAKKAKLNFNKLKVAVQVGCHYLYSPYRETIKGEEGEDILEDIALAFNAKVVDYEEKRTCCGGPVIKWLGHVTSTISHEKAKSFIESDADLLLTMCPTCLATLDKAQQELMNLGKVERTIPILHVSQFVALALGFDSVKTLGFHLQLSHQELQALHSILNV